MNDLPFHTDDEFEDAPTTMSQLQDETSTIHERRNDALKVMAEAAAAMVEQDFDKAFRLLSSIHPSIFRAGSKSLEDYEFKLRMAKANRTLDDES